MHLRCDNYICLKNGILIARQGYPEEETGPVQPGRGQGGEQYAARAAVHEEQGPGHVQRRGGGRGRVTRSRDSKVTISLSLNF